VFSQFPGVPRAQVRDPEPAFQPFAEKFGKAKAVVVAVAMNPARMILRAEPAMGLDRADHTHNGQPNHSFARRLPIWRGIPAA